jgi:TetR/AcrR family transcriptional repressor of nem operon
MGRSKEFDESLVLQKAMELFWAQGYEKTSMSELLEHMGIHRKSLYDTFGDKRQLYLRAIESYGKYSAEVLKSKVSDAATVKQEIENAFDYIIEGNEDKHLGCFFVNAATEMAPIDKEVDEIVNQAFLQTEHVLSEIIDKGQQSGEISGDYNAQVWAEFLHNALTGIRVLVRTSTSKDKMYRIKDMFLNLLFN